MPHAFPRLMPFDLFIHSSSLRSIWLNSLWWLIFSLLDAFAGSFFSYQGGLDDILLPKYPLNCLILTYNYI